MDDKDMELSPTLTPEDATLTRNILREALCIMLGCDNDCNDETLLESAKEWGKTHG